MTKLKAFTIMELTVVLLITSIAISIAYTCFRILNTQYLSYKATTESIGQVSLLERLIAQDFLKCRYVATNEEGFDCNYREKKIRYVLNEDYILRLESEVKDTFFVKPEHIQFSLFRNEVKDEGKIADQLSFESSYKEELQYFRFNKMYGADMVMQFKQKENEIED